MMRFDDENEINNDILEGRNPVCEALRTGRQINKLWVASPPEGKRYDPMTYKIMQEARAGGAVVIETDRKTLDKISVTHGHQGIIAKVAAHNYSSLEDILVIANERCEAPFVLILDGLKDSYNLGSILRVADAAGVHGVFIPRHRSVGLDAAVAKASSGAIEHIPVAKVTNLSNLIDELKDKGFWIYSTHQDADKMYNEIDYSGPAAIVIGSEGEGISSGILKKSDFMIKIPMKGKVNSLNAAVAAGIVVFEAANSRSRVKHEG